MGTLTLIHRLTGFQLLSTSDLLEIETYLTDEEKSSREYYIEVSDDRGHLCNALFCTDSKRWVLRDKSSTC